ncbi:copper chaperone PCu(A)C [Pelagibacterium sp.]|uniref:copper chaperone PCu(A)C n=1 Tax=Pelagibacterium sp. TaxID=1967288 RepID=UPI003A8F18C3
MIRSVSRAAIAAASIIAVATPALAHMTFEDTQSTPGASFRGVLVLPHGCDGAPTDTVRVNLPEGFGDVTAEDKDGWVLEMPSVDGQVAQTTWSGGSVPDDSHEQFAFTGTFADDLPETDILFAVEQMCGDVALGWEPVVSLGENNTSDHAHHGGEAVTLGDLELTSAFTRATLPNAPVGGGYVAITNTGDQADRLVSAESSFSPDVQIHEMAVVDDVMKMQQLPEGLEIPAGETVTLAPGGLHLMFMNISEPFVEGQTVPVTLTFERAGAIEIELAVQAFGASTTSHSEHEGH